MGIFVKQSLKIFIYIVLINSWPKLSISNQIDLNAAKQEFVNGNYDKSILLASKINSISHIDNLYKKKAKELSTKIANLS